jgi:hypothetical protein
MKIWHIVLTIFIGLAAAGCRSDPSRDLLERDNWKKEQEIYRLQCRVQELEENLQASQPAERPPKTYSGGERRAEPRTFNEGTAPARGAAPSSIPPVRRNPESEMVPPGGIEVTPGTEAAPGEIPERMRSPAGSGPARPISSPRGPSLDGSSADASPQWRPGGVRLAPNSAPSEDRAVAQITLHPALTGGIGTKSHAGDEGLLVVVEPRDFAGNIVGVPGDISVALLDPALSGEQARLARWDFTADQTQRMIHTGAEPGIHIRLPWNSMPAHDRLKVFVRFTTHDGKKLQAERLIGVALSEPLTSERETPSEAAKPAETASRPQWSPER